MTTGTRLTVVVACAIWLMAGAACDESFDPVAPGQVELSVYGYLDASADTQWMRVMPIRSVMLTRPDSFDVTVTVEELGTGRVVELRDSLFSYSPRLYPEVGSEGVFLHNYWTTEPIGPGAGYRLSTVRDGGEPAEAVVTIPDLYEVEVWISQTPFETDSLRVIGPPHLPFVAVMARFQDGCGSASDSVWHQGGSADDGVHTIAVEREGIVPRGACGRPRVVAWSLWIIGSAAPWPSGEAYSPWGLGGSERAWNVTNGVGFVGGVLTREIPWEQCAFAGGSAGPVYCRLRYDGESATLLGTASETRCGDGPVDSVTVELREIDGEPPARRKVRTVLTTPDGSYAIGALEPGTRYALKARAQPVPDPFWGEVDNYTLHYDTLTFTAGKRLTYDIGLERLTDCGLEP